MVFDRTGLSRSKVFEQSCGVAFTLCNLFTFLAPMLLVMDPHVGFYHLWFRFFKQDTCILFQNQNEKIFSQLFWVK